MKRLVRVLVVGVPTESQLATIQAFHRRWWNVVEIDVRRTPPARLKLTWWVSTLPPPRTPSGQAFALDSDGCVWRYDRGRRRWFYKKSTQPVSPKLTEKAIERTALFNGEDPEELKTIFFDEQLRRQLVQILAVVAHRST